MPATREFRRDDLGDRRGIPIPVKPAGQRNPLLQPSRQARLGGLATHLRRLAPATPTATPSSDRNSTPLGRRRHGRIPTATLRTHGEPDVTPASARRDPVASAAISDGDSERTPTPRNPPRRPNADARGRADRGASPRTTGSTERACSSTLGQGLSASINFNDTSRRYAGRGHQSRPGRLGALSLHSRQRRRGSGSIPTATLRGVLGQRRDVGHSLGRAARDGYRLQDPVVRTSATSRPHVVWKKSVPLTRLNPSKRVFHRTTSCIRYGQPNGVWFDGWSVRGR